MMAGGGMPTQQQMQEQQQKNEQAAQMREELLQKVLAPDAQERLGRIKLVKADKARSCVNCEARPLPSGLTTLDTLVAGQTIGGYGVDDGPEGPNSVADHRRIPQADARGHFWRGAR